MHILIYVYIASNHLWTMSIGHRAKAFNTIHSNYRLYMRRSYYIQIAIFNSVEVYADNDTVQRI